MSDFQSEGSSAADIAAGHGAGAGLCGAASTLPGPHPGALAAEASSAGLAELGVKGVAGNWDPGNPEKDQSLLPNERKLRLGIDLRNDSKSCVCDIELGATVTANTFETGAAPQSGVLGGGPDTLYCREGSAGGGAGAVGNLDASSPATPEGDAISKAAAIAAAEVFNGPASDSDFLNGQSTAAQQIIAALRSLPPQDGEREPDWTATARHMLEVWDAWLGGKAPARRDDADRLLMAACFAAQEFEDLASSGMTADGAPGGLLRAFLLALIDPGLPELDHLRACNRQPAALTAQPVAQEPVAGIPRDQLSASERLDWLMNGPPRIWMQSNGTGPWFIRPVGPSREYIRADLAHPATPAPVEAGLIRDAARYRWLRERDVDAIDKGGVFAGMTPQNVVLSLEDLDAAVDAARAQSAPVGGEVKG